MSLKALCVTAFIVLASCAGSAPSEVFTPPDGGAQACYRTFETVYHADPSFTEGERAQIVQATNEWAEFTGGQANTVVQFKLGGPNQIVRLLSTSQTTVDEDAYQTKRHGMPWTSLGWTTNTKDIYLVIDRVKTNEVHSLAAHEMGHTMGLEWPNCDGAKYDCIHSNDPSAVMFPNFTGDHYFTSGDLTFCRASCLCP